MSGQNARIMGKQSLLPMCPSEQMVIVMLLIWGNLT